MLTVILFYVFSAITIFSGIAVISARNPVYSVLFLILAFFNVAGLFVLLGAEFLAMLLVIVYVGAVAVLFLFIVMMLNVGENRVREGFAKYLPVGLVVAAILFAEIFAVMNVSVDELDFSEPPVPYMYKNEQITNTEVLGLVVYTDYAYIFQLAGLILLVAMIGAIVLTHRKREGVRKQNINKQVMRRREDAYEIVKVKPGQGV